MAQASRRVRRERRVRRQATLAKQTTKKVITDYQRTYLTLLYVLAQRGGSVTVSHGTMLEIMKKAPTMRWQARDNPEQAGEVIVEIVEMTSAVVDESAEETEPALTITRIPDEDDMVSPADYQHDPTHPELEEARFAGEGCPHGD